MKLYAIKGDKKTTYAYLFCYPKNKEFVIELSDKADHWEIPLLLSSYAQKGLFSVDPYHSRLWVHQRIVPYERQNIGQVLKDNGLKVYDELALLDKSDGRCAQDDYYIEKIDTAELPKGIKNRLGKRIETSVPLGNGQYMITFQNGKVKKCNINPLVKSKSELSTFLNAHPDHLDKAIIAAGGSVLRWDERLMISCAELYDSGTLIQVSADELKTIISSSIIDTAQACELLGCSRQYINELVSSGKLVPIKSNEKSTLFLKTDVEKILW